MKEQEEPLNPRSRAQGCVSMRPALSSPSVWMSLISTGITIVSTIAFTGFFQKALDGFSKQVNAFVQVGDFGSLFLEGLVTVLSVAFILYVCFVNLASAKFFTNFLRGCGTSCVLFFTSFGSQAFLVAWVLVLCLVSALMLVYFLFIGGIYSFCALLDQQCFDFSVLIPAIMSRFTNKKVDMVMCAEKKQLLCYKENNMIWAFGAAFACALITFIGTLLLQNCLVYGFGLRRGKTNGRKAHESYEMTTKS